MPKVWLRFGAKRFWQNMFWKETKGYTKHPQLLRFKKLQKSGVANFYLNEIRNEAFYNFDSNKIGTFENAELLLLKSFISIENWQSYI